MSRLDALDALVGEWTMEATPPGGPPWEGEARATFEWLEGRTWLIERSTVELPEAPDSIAIMGLADAPASANASTDPEGGYRQHYFDSRGVHRVYEMSLSDDEWKLWREGPPFDQRFTGTFEGGGNKIVARWEAAKDGSSWETDFDLIYTKVS